MNSFPLREFTAVSFRKISLKVLLLRLLLGSLLFVVGCDAWLFLLLEILPQTSQLSVNSCAIDQSVTSFLGWRSVCLLKKSQQSVFSRLVSIPCCNNNVAVCNCAGWDKDYTEKADCKQSRQWEKQQTIKPLRPLKCPFQTCERGVWFMTDVTCFEVWCEPINCRTKDCCYDC